MPHRVVCRLEARPCTRSGTGGVGFWRTRDGRRHWVRGGCLGTCTDRPVTAGVPLCLPPRASKLPQPRHASRQPRRLGPAGRPRCAGTRPAAPPAPVRARAHRCRWGSRGPPGTCAASPLPWPIGWPRPLPPNRSGTSCCTKPHLQAEGEGPMEGKWGLSAARRHEAPLDRPACGTREGFSFFRRAPLRCGMQGHQSCGLRKQAPLPPTPNPTCRLRVVRLFDGLHAGRPWQLVGGADPVLALQGLPRSAAAEHRHARGCSLCHFA